MYMYVYIYAYVYMYVYTGGGATGATTCAGVVWARATAHTPSILAPGARSFRPDQDKISYKYIYVCM